MTVDQFSAGSDFQPSILHMLAQQRGSTGVIHPRFGDLAFPGAVRMSVVSRVDFPGDSDDVIIHLTVTGRCNARCEGCINTALEAGCHERAQVIAEFECVPSRDAGIIQRLALSRGGRPVTVALYGGEPLLELDRVMQLVRTLDASPVASRVSYMVYTNGQLLGASLDSYPEFWTHVKLLSVSLDGDAAQHQRYRAGTDLATIEAGLVKARQLFRGEVLLWATLREGQSLRNCFDQFLTYRDRALADHFFWHWAESPEPYDDFQKYLRRYGSELESVVQIYVERLQHGELLSVVHLNELVLYLMTGEVRGHSACAVELAENFDIVGGRLTACADLPLSIGTLPDSAIGQATCPDLRGLVTYRGSSWLRGMRGVPVLRRTVPGAGAGRFPGADVADMPVDAAACWHSARENGRNSSSAGKRRTRRARPL